MKKTRIKTYLTIPVFLGMLLVTGRVAADEVEAAAKLESSSSATVSAVPTTVTAETNPVPPQGTYTFTETTGVKAEPIQASPDLDFYQPGEQAHYDKTVENDDRLWISYNSNSGKRSYVAVRDLPDNPKTAPVSSPAATDPETLPDQGRYKFTEKTPVKAEPKLSSPDRAFYDAGETVNYDKKLEADDRLWLTYVNYSGGRSYVAVKKLKPAAPAPVSQPLAPVVAPAATPSSTPSVSASLPSRGAYTFTTKTGVKSEPKVSAKNHDFYTPGEKVNYDKTLEADSHLWLSYINYSGGRSYVAVKELKPETPAPTSVSQPTSSTPAPSATPTTTGSISNSFPSRGTYTFTAKTGVKSEPKISAPDRAHYTVGEKVNYDKTLEQDNHLWLSYVNYSGGRSYVAVKELKPATPAPVSQPSAPAPVVAPSSSSSASTSLPSRGTYTFTAKTGVKSEPKISAPDRDYYTPGERVNYDKTLEQDNHLWLSYVNYSGGRSYVAVKELKSATPAPVSQPSAPAPVVAPSSSSSASTSLPSRGTYTFTAKTGVKSEPKISAPDRAHYTAGEKVNYDKTLEADDHLWLSYVNYSGGRSYVAVKELKPAAPAPVSQPSAPAPVVAPSSSSSASTSLPSRGTYTFTAKTGVKSEPKISAPDRAHYTAGEKVNYDKTLEQDNHLWLSYINYSGGRSYVAVKELKPVAPVVVPISTETDRPIAQPSSPSVQPSTPTQPEIPVEQPTVPASTESPVFESTSSEASVGQTDSPTVTAQPEIPAEKPTVTEQISSPVQPTHPVVPAPKPVQTSPAFPSRGVYTFTEKTGVKSQPRLISPDRDYYYPGENVNYDKTLEADDHFWLSYVNYSGGRSYVAIKSLKRQLTEEELKEEAARKHNAQVAVTDYQENKTNFTVQVTGQEDTKRMTKVRIAVWSDDKVQDDLRWYEPVIESNKAQAKVSIANHSNISDTYKVQVYTTYSDKEIVASPIIDQVIVKPSLEEIYESSAVNSASESVKKIFQIAGELLGVQGGGAAHKQLVDDYNAIKPLPVSYKVTYEDDWCDVFTTVVFQRAGLTHLIGRECGVERHIGIFQNLGIWNEDGTTTPKMGDIITFNWDQNRQANNGFADHIAIVTHVENGLIHTIEGNKDNEVKRYSYKIGDGNIRGFARPRYI